MASEIRGVRRTIDDMVQQEMRGRPERDRAQVVNQVREVARRYDRDVSDGREPPPPLANQD